MLFFISEFFKASVVYDSHTGNVAAYMIKQNSVLSVSLLGQIISKLQYNKQKYTPFM